MSIRSRVKPPASVSKIWATAARSVSPRSPVRSSMADKKEKPAKGAAAPAEAKKSEGSKKPESAKIAAARAAKEMPKGVAQVALPADYVPRLKKHYDDVVRPALIKEFG